MESKKIKYSMFVLIGIVMCFCIRKLYFFREYLNNVFVDYTGTISVVALLISALSLGSIYLLILQLKSEHEKARREKACELLQTWSKELREETNLAKKIVEKFTKEQCRKLYMEEKFKVSCALYNDIVEVTNTKSESRIERQQKDKGMSILWEEDEEDDKYDEYFKIKSANPSYACGLDDCVGSGDCEQEIELTKRQVRKLRHCIISYLNLLESILVAWQYSIADREIIEDQFSFLFSPKEGHNALQDYRIACGAEEAYPAIAIFCMHLESKAKKKLKERDKIV